MRVSDYCSIPPSDVAIRCYDCLSAPCICIGRYILRWCADQHPRSRFLEKRRDLTALPTFPLARALFSAPVYRSDLLIREKAFAGWLQPKNQTVTRYTIDVRSHIYRLKNGGRSNSFIIQLRLTFTSCPKSQSVAIGQLRGDKQQSQLCCTSTTSFHAKCHRSSATLLSGWEGTHIAHCNPRHASIANSSHKSNISCRSPRISPCHLNRTSGRLVRPPEARDLRRPRDTPTTECPRARTCRLRQTSLRRRLWLRVSFHSG